MENTNIFCTLFDSKYLDKGLALYESLKKVCPEFRLYIFAFDRKAFSFLKGRESENLKIFFIEDIENEEMRTAKYNRSRGEYCWTCTPIIIEYVLEVLKEKICTYLDADLYFYQSPEILLSEFEKSEKSVMIIPHNYYNCLESRLDEKNKGKYCVEFNTFCNDAEGRKVLKWWKERCLECCSSEVGEKTFGDQKYLDFFDEISNEVYVLKNQGAGVAPWNIAAYKLTGFNGNEIRVRRGKEQMSLVFYHFHNIHYLSENTVDVRVFVRPGRAEEELVKKIYIPYLRHIRDIRKEVKAAEGIDFKASIEMQKPKKKKGKRTQGVLLSAVLKIRREFRHVLWRKKDYLHF